MNQSTMRKRVARRPIPGRRMTRADRDEWVAILMIYVGLVLFIGGIIAYENHLI